MAKIEDLLHRRTDLSTFLVHFTREGDGMTAHQRLLRILEELCLRPGQVLGMGRFAANCWQEIVPSFYESQRVVCFTETPLEHAWMMCEDIEKRQTTFAPYGLAFTKTWGRANGVNPVWYLDISARGIDWLTVPINQMIAAALENDDSDHDIFKLTPFIEQMGPMNQGGQKEFSWEREWRVAGRVLSFHPADIVVVLAPADQHQTMAQELAEMGSGYSDLKFIDPRWGLERIVARLAGVPDHMAGPWPAGSPPTPQGSDGPQPGNLDLAD